MATALSHSRPCEYDPRGFVRWATSIAAIVAALVGAGVGDAARVRSAPAVAPQVAVFYYTWYGTPRLDGAWLHWSQGHNQPPQALGSTYYPARGPYSSADRALVRAQMREIAAAGIDTLVVSWWGPGSAEDKRLRPVAKAARSAGLRVALHVEPWNGRTPSAVVDALRGMKGLGIRDVYVYDSTRDADDAWQASLARLGGGMRVFAHTNMAGKAAKGGFQGLYTYDVLVYDGRSFRRMCTAAHRLKLACAPSVGPGFDAFRATGDPRLRGRADGRWYDHMWAAAVRARPDVVTITSYNEWHEGTQIEPARAYGPYATYDGAWGLTGASAERAYLDRTAYWVKRLRDAA